MTGSTSPVTRSHRQQVHDYRPREQQKPWEGMPANDVQAPPFAAAA
jgi:hypothetical protein